MLIRTDKYYQIFPVEITYQISKFTHLHSLILQRLTFAQERKPTRSVTMHQILTLSLERSTFTQCTAKFTQWLSCPQMSVVKAKSQNPLSASFLHWNLAPIYFKNFYVTKVVNYKLQNALPVLTTGRFHSLYAGCRLNKVGMVMPEPYISVCPLPNKCSRQGTRRSL